MITQLGSYAPESLSEDERQALWEGFGHSGQAPRGYGGEGGGGSSGGSSAPFSFDYVAEATKAYGELGVYYDRILKESQGDLTKALARLTEDYDTGVRYKTQDTAFTRQTLANEQAEADRQARLAEKGIENTSLARGLFRQSGFEKPQGPQQGYGITDTSFKNLGETVAYQNTSRLRQGQLNEQALARYMETQNVFKSRQETDLPEAQRRYAAEQERNRRLEAAEMSNVAGERAYQKYVASAGLT